MLTIISIVVALIAGFTAAKLHSRKTILNLEARIVDSEDSGWKTGFGAGWDAASDDYFHVKNRYETLRSEREY